jgi:hypothetical protein
MDGPPGPSQTAVVPGATGPAFGVLPPANGGVSVPPPANGAPETYTSFVGAAVPTMVTANGIDGAAALPTPTSIAAPDAAGPPPTAPFTFDTKTWKTAVQRSKHGIMLGILGRIGEEQEQWEPEMFPFDFPYDPDDPDRAGKTPYETLQTFLTGVKGRSPVVTVSGAQITGAALLESLARVLTALPLGLGLAYSPDPLTALADAIRAPRPNVDLRLCTAADCEFVGQMIAIHRIRQHCLGGKRVDRYGGQDLEVLTLLKRIGGAFPQRLERWGTLIAQMFVDFVRHLGDLAACQVWEKRTTVTATMLRGFLRAMPYTTQEPLSAEAMSDLALRARV